MEIAPRCSVTQHNGPARSRKACSVADWAMLNGNSHTGEPRQARPHVCRSVWLSCRPRKAANRLDASFARTGTPSFTPRIYLQNGIRFVVNPSRGATTPHVRDLAHSPPTAGLQTSRPWPDGPQRPHCGSQRAISRLSAKLAAYVAGHYSSCDLPRR